MAAHTDSPGTLLPSCPADPWGRRSRTTQGMLLTLPVDDDWIDRWRAPLLDASEERRLALAVEAGLLARGMLEQGCGAGTRSGDSVAELRLLDAEGRAAWRQLHAANAGLVVMAVREVSGGVDNDLVQHGWLALGEALRRFDVMRGLRLATFAYPCVRHAVAAAHRRHSTPWTIGDHGVRALHRVAALRAEQEERGLQGNPEEIARELGCDAEWVAQHWWRPEAAPVELAAIADSCADESAGVALPGDWWLDELPCLERRILVLRYGLRGHAVVGWAALTRELDLPLGECRQIERRALRHVRDLILHGEYAGGGLLMAS